jgi:hypothetical protein
MKTIGDAPPARTLAALHEERLAKTKTVPDAPPARALVRDVPAGTPGSDVIDALKPGGKLGPPPAASSEARATLTPSEERAGAAALDPLTEETRQAASKKKQKASRPDAPKKPPASTGPANAPRWPDNKINADQLEKRLHAGELELVPEAIRNDPRFDALSTENAGITGRGRIEAAAGITAQRDASQQIVGLTRDPSTVDEFLVTFSPESGKKPLTYDVKSFYRHPEVGLDAWKTQTTADIDSYLRRGVNLLIDESFMTPRELAVVRQAIQESSLPAAKNVLRARVSW